MKRVRRPSRGASESDAKKARTSPDASPDDRRDDSELLPTSSWNLPALLNLTNLPSVTSSSLADRLSEISSAIILRTHLVVRNAAGQERRFRIVELEYYLHYPGIHEDPFIHGSEEQKTLGQWYFHRAKSKNGHGNFKGGSRKGLDLTFGSPATGPSSEIGIRGGIILRSIEDVATGAVTSGPCNLVHKILASSALSPSNNDGDTPSIQDLVTNQWHGDISSFKADDNQAHNSQDRCRLYLEGVASSSPSSSPPRTIFHSPRVGLELGLSTQDITSPLLPASSPYFSKGKSSASTSASSQLGQLRDHPRAHFLPKRYRHYVLPPNHSQDLVGKPQTFLGVLYTLSSRLNIQPSSLDTSPADRETLIKKLSDHMGITRSRTESLLSVYLDKYGKSNDSNDIYTSISPYLGKKQLTGMNLLGMFAVLDKMQDAVQ